MRTSQPAEVNAASAEPAETPASVVPAKSAEIAVLPPGPGAVTWYVAGDLRFLLMSIRALTMQVAHPMVGAAVGEHSVYKEDPWGRLWRTAMSVVRQVYGGYGAAEEGARLMRLHREIKGVDDKGRRYSAVNPGAYVWVHATMFESWRYYLRHHGPGLTRAQEDQLFDEWRRVGVLLGCPDKHLPADVEAFDDYFAGMLSQVENNAVVQDVLFATPKAPFWIPQFLLDLVNRPLLRLQRSFATETLPGGLAELFELRPTKLTAAETRWLSRFNRLVGLVPTPLRRSPLAAFAAWRTTRDPRITPEPTSYP